MRSKLLKMVGLSLILMATTSCATFGSVLDTAANDICPKIQAVEVAELDQIEVAEVMPDGSYKLDRATWDKIVANYATLLSVVNAYKAQVEIINAEE